MSKYYEEMLMNKLLDKFERSKLSKNGSTKKIRISLLFDDKNMADYVCDRSYLYERDIEESVRLLKGKKLIDVLYNDDDRIKKIFLNIENVDIAYHYLGRKSVKTYNEEITDILAKYKNHGSIVNKFVNDIESRLKDYKTNNRFFKNAAELEEILFILDKIENQKEEISLRSFSAKYLRDSKRLEKIENKIESIIRLYANIYDEDDGSADILNYFNIYKNPSFVYLKGTGIFQINNQVIDLKLLDSELILSNKQVNNLSVMGLDCKEIVTVENLTSFYDYPSTNRCVIYLGGFHNEVRKNLLCKLNKFNPDIPFYHSGDIDAGGFYILNHLIDDTGIPFKSINMNFGTLEKYKSYTISLTEEDKKRIVNLKSYDNMKIYIDTLEYMLKNNVKLEQENIKYY